MQRVKKVVLAYSGGLDTSVILKWLQEEYDCEVVTFTADIGQGEEIGPVREKAKKALGDKFNIKDFHSAVLDHGNPHLFIVEEMVDKMIEESKG